MSPIVAEYLRCLACFHEYTENVEKGVDRERTCPKCRSNSIRVVKAPKQPKP